MTNIYADSCNLYMFRKNSKERRRKEKRPEAEGCGALENQRGRGTSPKHRKSVETAAEGVGLEDRGAETFGRHRHAFGNAGPFAKRLGALDDGVEIGFGHV